MFTPKTEKIKIISLKKEKEIAQLEKILQGEVIVYIDFANIRPWSRKLGWNFSIKRLKQFLDSFDNIQTVKFYSGLLEGDQKSEKEIKKIKESGYVLITKPVKIMRIPIDSSSISHDSPALLNNFIRKALLRNFEVSTIEFLNQRLKRMNDIGIRYIEDRKCNFDVEMATDMLLDNARGQVDTFVLWSGDSDFADTAKKLLSEGKNVIVFGTAGRISRELSELKKEGLIIFDVKKIAKFVCWKKQIESLT